MNWIFSTLAALGLVVSVSLPQADVERAKADAAAAYCYAALAEEGQPAPQPKQTLRVLVFGAEWCGPCQTMHAALARDLPPKGWKIGPAAGDDLEFVDVGKDRERARKYTVTGVPATVIVTADGSQVAKITGGMPSDFFIKWAAEKGKTVSK